MTYDHGNTQSKDLGRSVHMPSRYSDVHTPTPLSDLSKQCPRSMPMQYSTVLHEWSRSREERAHAIAILESA
jgi:hypothetical protein